MTIVLIPTSFYTRGGDRIMEEVDDNAMWLPPGEKPVMCLERAGGGTCELCERDPPAWGPCRMIDSAPPEQGSLDL